MRRLATTTRRQDGFTLSEMLAALALIGAMFAMFAAVVSSTIKHDSEVREQTTLQTEVRAAIEMLAGELRQAYSGDDTVAPLESISATQITFLSPDRAQPFHMRRISWRLASGKLERAFAASTDTDGAPWTISALGGWARRAGSITNTTLLTYRDSAGNPLVPSAATADDVHTVGISVTVATVTSPNRPYKYTTSVTLRTPYAP
jgi:prepilin-type N-terminal cleavage/methylation domain-containing protein